MGCSSSVPVVTDPQLRRAYQKSVPPPLKVPDQPLVSQKSADILGIPVGTPPKALKRL